MSTTPTKKLHYKSVRKSSFLLFFSHFIVDAAEYLWQKTYWNVSAEFSFSTLRHCCNCFGYCVDRTLALSIFHFKPYSRINFAHARPTNENSALRECGEKLNWPLSVLILRLHGNAMLPQAMNACGEERKRERVRRRKREEKKTQKWTKPQFPSFRLSCISRTAKRN